MICGNTSDIIDHPLPKHFVSAHGASLYAWAPVPPPSKSGAGKHQTSVNADHCKYVVFQIIEIRGE